MNRWTSTRARLYFAFWPVFMIGLGFVMLSDDLGPMVVVTPVAAFFLVRALRIEMRLDPEALYVRNPLRTYRVPYRETLSVREVWKDLVAKNPDRHVFGSYLLRALTEDIHIVDIFATWFLPESERQAARDLLAQLVREPPADEDEDDDVDESPPFPEVVAILADVHARETGRPVPAVYRYEAADIAGILRERDITDDDLTDEYAWLIDRFNALRE